MLNILRRSNALRIPVLRQFIFSPSPSIGYRSPLIDIMAPKRKRTVANIATTGSADAQTNPVLNPEIVDAPNALRASPDSDVDRRLAPGPIKDERESGSPLSDVPEVAAVEPPKKKRNPKKPAEKKSTVTTTTKVDVKGDVSEAAAKVNPAKKTPAKENNEMEDPEADGEEEADEEAVQEALSRPPPVNSDYLPLPWKGRLGYVSQSATEVKLKTDRVRGMLEHLPPP